MPFSLLSRFYTDLNILEKEGPKLTTYENEWSTTDYRTNIPFVTKRYAYTVFYQKGSDLYKIVSVIHEFVSELDLRLDEILSSG